MGTGILVNHFRPHPLTGSYILYPPWEIFFNVFVYIKPNEILILFFIKVLRGVQHSKVVRFWGQGAQSGRPHLLLKALTPRPSLRNPNPARSFPEGPEVATWV